MKSNTKAAKTAILIFQESSKQLSSIHQMAPRISSKRAKEVVSILNAKANKVAQQAGFDVFNHQASRQISYGSAVRAALQDTFAKGYSKVIAISNDCPRLESEDLRLAAQKLIDQDYVLGPANDGGLYLLGVNHSSFCQIDWNSLPWQSNQLAITLDKQLLQIELKGSLLEYKDDLDTVQDFQKAFLVASKVFKDLQSTIASFLHTTKSIFSTVFIAHFTHSLFLRRGPPLSV